MRRTPLTPGPPPTRKQPIKRHYPRNTVSAKVRAVVLRRSLGQCEIRVTCGGWGAQHLHHRLMRSHGGSHGAKNLLACCFACHAYVHAHPAESYDRGWLIRSTGDTP